MLTNDQLCDLLRRETLKISRRKWAKDNGAHQAQVNRIINGEQAMTESKFWYINTLRNVID